MMVAGSVTLLPETLTAATRRTLGARDVLGSCRTVLRSPGTLRYLLSLTALYGVFLSYLASSEIILDQVFGLKAWFPVFFGGIALLMGSAMFLSGRVVERMGLSRIIRFGFVANLVSAAALTVVAVVTAGEPPFWLFVVLLGAVLFFQQMLIPNLNAAAMRPLGAVAGTGSAMLGMVPGVLGAVIGGLIDQRFDGTILPLSIAFFVSSAVAYAAWRWALADEARARLPNAQ
jgi:DHA1 family bicyclomycin/chloramphenicol resistance-like MFS transporter